MSARVLPLSMPNLSEEEVSAVAGVIRSGWLTQGPMVAEFEAEFAAFTQSRFAVAVANCTLALELALILANVKSEEEVIMPSLNYVAAANAARRLGAAPVFADVSSPSNLCLDPSSIMRVITSRTRALCVLHYAGFAADMEEIRHIAAKKEITVIEDCAHAPGAQFCGKPCGSLADIGVFSFFSNKNITTGEGGMLTVQREDWRDHLLLLRSNGMTKDSWTRHLAGSPLYDVVTVGTNARLDEVRAAIGRVQLRRLPEFLERRRNLVKRYRLALRNVEELIVPFEDEQVAPSSNHLFVVLLPNSLERSTVISEMQKACIHTSVHYTPIHHLTEYRSPQVRLKQTDSIAGRLLTLPLFPDMTNDDVDRVCGALREVLTHGSAKSC